MFFGAISWSRRYFAVMLCLAAFVSTSARSLSAQGTPLSPEVLEEYMAILLETDEIDRKLWSLRLHAVERLGISALQDSLIKEVDQRMLAINPLALEIEDDIVSHSFYLLVGADVLRGERRAQAILALMQRERELWEIRRRVMRERSIAAAVERFDRRRTEWMIGQEMNASAWLERLAVLEQRKEAILSAMSPTPL